MPDEPGCAYDSFVVRLWHEPATGTVLRAEVEHVQGGTVDAGRRVAPEWILDRLRACLERPKPEVPATPPGPRAPPAAAP